MRIVTVVGARPQFIKAAVVSHVLRNKHQEILVHTGQHFDYNMSEQFFEELDIPKPDYNLGISGGTHAQMTGNMMIAIEEVLQKEQPDWLLLYGDTNSTIAAAIAAAKLHIKICHVEAGTRFHVMTNPEEINRICTDHVSTLLSHVHRAVWTSWYTRVLRTNRFL
jgi:UDP-N-acetylglucosamine 2-epimerase (non-hydrolysing)/UDP-GlcNAc3NAcA epimerase